MPQFPAISRRYREMVDELIERVVVRVVTAEPLPPEMLSGYRRRIQLEVGHSALIQQVVEPLVVGGARVVIRHLLIDGTLSSQLQRLGDSLGLPRDA